MKIIFVSFISSSNLGDQLIVKTIDEHIFKAHTVKKFDYDLVSEDKLGVLSPPKESSFLKKIYVNYFRKITAVDKLRDYINKYNVVKNPNWDAFNTDLATADLLVFGGGNAIFDLTKHSSSYFKMNRIIDEAKKREVPVFACSIGIGPFVTEQQLNQTIQTLKKCDYVTVRDKKSYDYLSHLENTHLSIDPVFGLEKQEKNLNPNRKTIGLSIIDLLNNKQSSEENNQYMDGLVKIIEELKQYNVVLYSTEPKDYKTVRDVYSKVSDLSYVNMEYIDTIDKLMDLYTRLDLIIGARMHSLIAGVSQDIPIIGLSWQPKVKAMFDMIDETDSVYPISTLDQNMDSIVRLVEEKLSLSKYNDKIQDTNQIVTEHLKINEKILKELTNKK